MADSDESDSGWVDTHSDHEEQPPVVSLLDNEVFPDVLSMLTYCREKYSFDFLGVRQELGLDDDFHGTVKLINYSWYFHSNQMTSRQANNMYSTMQGEGWSRCPWSNRVRRHQR